MQIKRIINPWKSIIIHHSLTKDSSTVSWSAIRDYHVHTLKWSDIGYHFGIEQISNRYEVLAGRPLDIPGAHTKGKNKTAIGVCCVGNYDITKPSIVMIKLLAKHLAGLCYVLKIPPTAIKAHRDFAKKSCPGNKFDMDYLRAEVEMLINN